MNSLIKWIEEHQGTCFYKKFLGIECPGCGLQTAFIALLKGDFLISIMAYPPLLPMIVMIIVLILHLIFKFKKGAFILKTLFILVALIVVINYVFKIITS